MTSASWSMTDRPCEPKLKTPAFARSGLGRFQVLDRVFRFLRASQLFFEEVIDFSCRLGSGKTEMGPKKGNQSITADAYGLSTVRLDRPPDHTSARNKRSVLEDPTQCWKILL